jgi:hypothetical protein
MLLCRTRPSPRKSGKTWAGNICGHIAHKGPCAAKISLCPAFALKATIVLPDFARSFSNDGKKKGNIIYPDDFK